MARSLKELAEQLRRLPLTVAVRVADESADAITDLARGTFDASEDPYGVDWRPGEHGQRVTLHKTGALERFIQYVAIGTKLRVSLGVKYAKYQIGKRHVFPRQGGILPATYSKTLSETAARVVREEMNRP